MSRFFRRGTSEANPPSTATSPSSLPTTSNSTPLPSTSVSTTSLPSTSTPPTTTTTSNLITSPLPTWSRPIPSSFTSEESTKLDQLKLYCQNLHHGIEITSEELTQTYKTYEVNWLQEENLYVRYMRAGKWDLENAKKRIKGTLEWRRSFQPDLIVPSSVSIEGETGKHVISGFDLQGRPILYLRPGRENTKPSDRQVRYLVWSLERALDFCPVGVEKICIFVDFTKANNRTNPGLGTALKVLGILQNHYVERLGRAVVVNLPWVLQAFMAGITPFLDPVTKDKIRFNPPVLSDLIPSEQLDSQFGGQWNYRFDFDTYWNTLTNFCGIAEDGSRTHEPYSKTQSTSSTTTANLTIPKEEKEINDGQTVSKFLKSNRDRQVETEVEDEEEFKDAKDGNEVEIGGNADRKAENGSESTSRAETLVGNGHESSKPLVNPDENAAAAATVQEQVA